MKRSVSISTALLLSAAAFACTKKNTGMEGNNNRTEPQTQTAPDTTTPGATTTTPSDTGTMGTTTPGGTTDTTTGTSLNQPAPTANCPDPSTPGYDASKVDPACATGATGTPGTTTTPTTPSDANRPTTTP